MALLLFASLSLLIGGGAYCFLRPVWQQNEAISITSMAAKQSAELYQQNLVALPSVEETEQKIAALATLHSSGKPAKAIAQLLVEPLALSGGILTRLQRKTVREGDDTNRIGWSISLHVDYQGLLTLLESLLASSGLSIDLLNLQASASGLDVTLDLSTGQEQ
ncbi:hypothetical protein [Edaphovirga cremea]|uniref:hypothetical protein n=1 Tax=Edaphovirga cremea TaxID=2267246 RepID=UPI0013005E03|nr:hypothetical protein [Edaphovirga cremea]